MIWVREQVYDAPHKAVWRSLYASTRYVRREFDHEDILLQLKLGVKIQMFASNTE